MTYKFYAAQVTGSGYMPQGDCKGVLVLDQQRRPTWSELSPDFRDLCLPWFDNPVRMGLIDDLEPLVPYSDEALSHLAKHQLPSQGFVMVKVADQPSAPRPATGLPHPGFSPPPGLFKKK